MTNSAIINRWHVIMTVTVLCVLTFSGCFYLQHSGFGYRYIRNDKGSNVSMVLLHYGEAPATIEFQLILDGELVSPPTTIQKNSQKRYRADIRVKPGPHTLLVKVSNPDIQAQKIINITETPMYLWLKYQKIGDNEPTLEIKQMEYMPGFA